jgi:hypothetical protein
MSGLWGATGEDPYNIIGRNSFKLFPTVRMVQILIGRNSAPTGMWGRWGWIMETTLSDAIVDGCVQ